MATMPWEIQPAPVPPAAPPVTREKPELLFGIIDEKIFIGIFIGIIIAYFIAEMK